MINPLARNARIAFEILRRWNKEGIATANSVVIRGTTWSIALRGGRLHLFEDAVASRQVINVKANARKVRTYPATRDSLAQIVEAIETFTRVMPGFMSRAKISAGPRRLTERRVENTMLFERTA